MRILVIGTVRQAHQMIQKLGHEQVLFMNSDTAKPSDVEFGYEHAFFFNKDSESQEYVAVARALHQVKAFDAVCSFNDTTQKIAIHVADALQLSFPVSLDTLSVLYNKNKTRQVLQHHGLDDTEFETIESEAQLLSFIQRVNKTIIIKPIDATGSSGVAKIESANDVHKAIAWLKHCGQDFPVIAETFLEGEEFSVEAISEDGTHKILGITQKYKDPINFVELGHVFPAPLSLSQNEIIERFVCDILDALGITQGPTHTEVMLTAKGPKIIETHSRAGGDRIFELVELATGINIFEMTIRQACGERVFPTIERKRKKGQVAAIRFAAIGFDKDTKLKSINNLDSARAIGGVIEVSPMKQPGDVMDVVTNSFGRSALAISVSDNAKMSIELCERALNTLAFNLAWERN